MLNWVILSPHLSRTPATEINRHLPRNDHPRNHITLINPPETKITLPKSIGASRLEIHPSVVPLAFSLCSPFLTLLTHMGLLLCDYAQLFHIKVAPRHALAIGLTNI